MLTILPAPARGLLPIFLLGGFLLVPLLQIHGVESPRAGEEKVIVILEDGTELAGTLIDETPDRISIRSAFGVTTILRSKIKEIQRGVNPAQREHRERANRARRKKTAAGWYEVGDWARGMGLETEAMEAFGEAIKLDPDHEPSHLARGEARFEGKWIDSGRVDDLIAKGWVRRGADLVPGTGSGEVLPEPDVEAPEPRREGTSLEPRARVLSPEEMARRNRDLERRRKDREKFERKKRKEFEGVPWSSRHVIKSTNYRIECNSTYEVARTYQWIMEALNLTLSGIFKDRSLRSQIPTVFIYRNHDEFMLKTGMNPGVGGFYQPSSQNVYGYHGTFGLTGTTYTVLAHEGTHQFQGRVLPRMANFPNWLIEGMAVYFGDGSKLDYRKRKIVTGLIPRDRLFHIQEKMREEKHTPLAKLPGLARNRFGGTHYADSWAIMHYLINGPKKSVGQRFLVDYWQLGKRRRVGQKEFNRLAEKYFGGVEALENDWQEYVLALRPDPAGSVEKGRFVSLDFMFTVERPSEEWEYVIDDLESDELVAMRLAGTDCEIRVTILPKPDAEQEAQVYIDEVLLPKLRKDYEFLSISDGNLGPFEASVIDYKDRIPAPVEDEETTVDGEEDKGNDPQVSIAAFESQEGDEPKGDEPSGDEEAAEEPVLNRYRSFVLVGVTTAYAVTGEFPEGEFEDRLADLEWVAFSFERTLRNRW